MCMTSYSLSGFLEKIKIANNFAHAQTVSDRPVLHKHMAVQNAVATEVRHIYEQLGSNQQFC